VEVLPIQHASLVFSGSNGTELQIPEVRLRFRENAGNGSFVGGEAVPFNGLASTRRGASSWEPILGKVPIGEWELALPDSMKELLRDEKVENILLVVTYQGKLPAWPA
jgi:hypothetical protein